MKSIVIAAHPDDETLGAGGAILRRKAEGHATAWLIVTSVSIANGWSVERVRARDAEIEAVRQLLRFDEVYRLELPTTQLDQLPLREIVSGVSEVFGKFQPNEIFVPHYSDVHSDHRIVFQAVGSCTKWFRYPFVQRILCYETLSETDVGLGEAGAFRPNYFLDIAPFIEQKIAALKVYSSELDEFPFPRSVEAVQAQAKLRGAASGYIAAEAFELLRERS
jgi:N-acetylglucosamine malate deacetylase 1